MSRQVARGPMNIPGALGARVARERKRQCKSTSGLARTVVALDRLDRIADVPMPASATRSVMRRPQGLPG